jgi:hypothetical protein
VPAAARVSTGVASNAAVGSGPPWSQAEYDDWQRWTDEFERRLLAGELGNGPEPLPHEEGEEFWRALERDQCLWDLPDYVPDDWSDADPDAGHDPFPDPDPDPFPDPGPEPFPGPAPESLDGSPPDDGEGWWAAADRAVDEASLAVRRVQEAMGRAAQLVNAAVVADAADEADWMAGPGRFNDATDALAVLRACTDTERARLSQLLSATAGGGLAERPRLLLTDALNGALLALTDLSAMRRAGRCDAPACRRNPGACTHDLAARPGLGPPPPTDAYRPSDPLDRWVRARDRRCRQPGCRRPVPRGGELDHFVPHPHGKTCAGNLNGFCTRHHRCKHQAPGWRYELDPDGTLTVTTPSGLTTSTEPPPY